MGIGNKHRNRSCLSRKDEKIVEEKIRNEIILFDNTIKINDFDFSERKYEKSIQKEFNIVKVNNDIILLSKNTQGKILAYQLDENNYIFTFLLLMKE